MNVSRVDVLSYSAKVDSSSFISQSTSVNQLSCSPCILFAKDFSAGGLTLGISLLNAVRPSGDNAV